MAGRRPATSKTLLRLYESSIKTLYLTVGAEQLRVEGLLQVSSALQSGREREKDKERERERGERERERDE